MTTVIEASGLGKKYELGRLSEPAYNTLREEIANGFRVVTQKIGLSASPRRAPRAQNATEEFWALRDVAFNVSQGDRLAIIGRNGAGKSTLLKILSRITEPTAGRVAIRGRVASLLEVGTGFHPELTGRENIFLNGAILGMTKNEIKGRFDEIVAFAEVEKFLDTAVKHYSSGMYVRLAFAVAAHLEPEILIVDEVLAVGDVAFQTKCLGRMEQIGKEGRTLIFVSHNMGAVERLCTSAMALNGGAVQALSNDVSTVVRTYLEGSERESSIEWVNPAIASEQDCMHPISIRLVNRDGKAITPPVRHDEESWISIQVLIRKLDPALCIGYAIYTEQGELLYWSYHTDANEADWPQLQLGVCTLTSMVPPLLLNEGNYRIEMVAGLHNQKWILEPSLSAPSIWLERRGGFQQSPYWTARRAGILAPVVKWHSKSSLQIEDGAVVGDLSLASELLKVPGIEHV